ncbi:hypothetical protein Tco_0611486 [Tanacetum coccineum]
MESTRRSSRRQPKIPNHFHDSIHDLNKKKDVMKNKATSVKGCVFDSVMDSQKNDSGNLMDSVGREDELKDTGLDIGEGVDVNIGNVESVKFGSVNDDMLKGNGGSHNVKLPNVKIDINRKLKELKPKSYHFIRFCNPPLETLTMKGISALASRIGKPLIMDARTASMCTQNVGRIGYARVLIEVPTKKGLPDKIDIVYKNAAKEVIGQKTIKENCKQNVNKKKRNWESSRIIKHALLVGGNNQKKGKERKENPIGSATKEVNTSGNKFSVLEDLDYKEELYEMEGIKNSDNIKKKTSLNGKEDWKHEMQKDNDDISVEMEDWGLMSSYPNEHSTGSSTVTSDMMDISRNVLSSGARRFINHNSISDHNPALLIIPNGMRFKRKSFKFANYITEKEEFCKIVEDKWKDNIGGWNMYNLVK